MLLVLATGHDTSRARRCSASSSSRTLAIAWRSDAAAARRSRRRHLSSRSIFLHWSLDFDVSELGLPGGPVTRQPVEARALSVRRAAHARRLLRTPVPRFGISRARARGAAARSSVLWAATAVFAPIAILIALYYRIAGFDRSIPFAGAASVLAGAFALATEMLTKRESEGGSRAASAIFATGSIASLALALSLALEKGWLTVALALMVPGHRLGRRAAASVRRSAGSPPPSPSACSAASPGTRVSSAMPSARGRSSIGCCTATASRPRLLVRRPHAEAPSRRCAGPASSTRPPSCSPFCSSCSRCTTISTAATPYGGGSELAQVGLDVSLLLAVVIGLERIRQKSGSIIHRSARACWPWRSCSSIVFGLGARRRSLADRRAGRRTDHQSRAARLWHARRCSPACSPL